MRTELVSIERGRRLNCVSKYSVIVSDVNTNIENLLESVLFQLSLLVETLPAEEGSYKIGFEIKSNSNPSRQLLYIPFNSSMFHVNRIFLNRLENISQSSDRFLDLSLPIHMCVAFLVMNIT